MSAPQRPTSPEDSQRPSPAVGAGSAGAAGSSDSFALPAPDSTAGTAPVVSVRGLSVDFSGAPAVAGVDLDLLPGRCVALVGESGSGKSVTARALLGLSGGRVASDRLLIDGQEASAWGERGWRGIRGRVIGTVLQDALGSLDPLRPVGREVADAARLAGVGLDVPALLRSVGLDPDAARMRPGQLSGGMRQRALIAAALAADPALVIADEPTTALDTTRQAVVLELAHEQLRVADTGVAGDGADRRAGPARAAVQLLREQQVGFAPGKHFWYSDTGYKVLGLALQAATGKAYADLIREKILEPLEMHNTFAITTSALRPRQGKAVNSAFTWPSNTTWLWVSASGLSNSGFMRTSGCARAASA